MEAVQIVTYVCAALFFVFVLARIIRYASTPIHLRWELYPVPHEKGRAHYGGSIFEELDWWTKPREIDRANELKEMFKEIILLSGVRHHNPKLWLYSFPFHFGLYLLMGWVGLMLLAAILVVAGTDMSGSTGSVLMIIITVTGHAGLVLTAAGAMGLFFRRAGDPDIRKYSSPVEFINLLFILLVMAAAIYVHTTLDPGFKMLTAYVASLIAFSQGITIPVAMKLEIILGSLLVAYIPATRMGHFVAKYFLYHDVRWSDEPNPRGSRIEEQVLGVLGRKVSWDASHIQTGKDWAEVGSSFKEEEK